MLAMRRVNASRFIAFIYLLAHVEILSPFHANAQNDQYSYKRCISGYKSLISDEFPFLPSRAEDYCNCTGRKISLINLQSQAKILFAHCAIFEGMPLNKGRISLLDSPRDYRLSFIKDSVVQVAPHGNYNRYLQVVITQDKVIKGRPAQMIPATQGYVKRGDPGVYRCRKEYRGFNHYEGAGALFDEVCETVGRTDDVYVAPKPAQYIPAIPDRVVTEGSKLTIDCDDWTYDFEGDGNNWQKITPGITGSYRYIDYFAQITCPFKSTFRKI